MTKALDRLEAAAAKAPIVPVLVINDVAHAAPLALELFDAGLTIAEVTLRTDAGLASIGAMKAECPDLVVGAGTVLSADDVQASLDAGADFLVSPGMTPKLLDGLGDKRAMMIPGVSTASEAMSRAEEGFEILKLFPAAVAGGMKALKALAGPLPHLRFMPTGGISGADAADYCALNNVIAVGGSWMVGQADLDAGNWVKVRQTAAAALAALRET